MAITQERSQDNRLIGQNSFWRRITGRPESAVRKVTEHIVTVDASGNPDFNRLAAEVKALVEASHTDIHPASNREVHYLAVYFGEEGYKVLVNPTDTHQNLSRYLRDTINLYQENWHITPTGFTTEFSNSGGEVSLRLIPVISNTRISVPDILISTNAGETVHEHGEVAAEIPELPAPSEPNLLDLVQQDERLALPHNPVMLPGEDDDNFAVVVPPERNWLETQLLDAVVGDVTVLRKVLGQYNYSDGFDILIFNSSQGQWEEKRYVDLKSAEDALKKMIQSKYESHLKIASQHARVLDVDMAQIPLQIESSLGYLPVGDEVKGMIPVQVAVIMRCHLILPGEAYTTFEINVVPDQYKPSAGEILALTESVRGPKQLIKVLKKDVTVFDRSEWTSKHKDKLLQEVKKRLTQGHNAGVELKKINHNSDVLAAHAAQMLEQYFAILLGILIEIREQFPDFNHDDAVQFINIANVTITDLLSKHSNLSDINYLKKSWHIDTSGWSDKDIQSASNYLNKHKSEFIHSAKIKMADAVIKETMVTAFYLPLSAAEAATIQDADPDSDVIPDIYMNHFNHVLFFNNPSLNELRRILQAIGTDIAACDYKKEVDTIYEEGWGKLARLSALLREVALTIERDQTLVNNPTPVLPPRGLSDDQLIDWLDPDKFTKLLLFMKSKSRDKSVKNLNKFLEDNYQIGFGNFDEARIKETIATIAEQKQLEPSTLEMTVSVQDIKDLNLPPEFLNKVIPTLRMQVQQNNTWPNYSADNDFYRQILLPVIQSYYLQWRSRVERSSDEILGMPSKVTEACLNICQSRMEKFEVTVNKFGSAIGFNDEWWLDRAEKVGDNAKPLSAIASKKDLNVMSIPELLANIINNLDIEFSRRWANNVLQVVIDDSVDTMKYKIALPTDNSSPFKVEVIERNTMSRAVRWQPQLPYAGI